MARGEDGDVLAAVARGRRHVADAAVLMLLGVAGTAIAPAPGSSGTSATTPSPVSDSTSISTRTLAEPDPLLAWATQERPEPTQLLEHVLGLEAAHKREQRIARRITTSGLTERKSLELGGAYRSVVDLGE